MVEDLSMIESAKNKHYQPLLYWLAVCAIFFLNSSCNDNKHQVDISGIEITAKIVPFAEELFEHTDFSDSTYYSKLTTQYPNYFDTYARFLVPDPSLSQNTPPQEKVKGFIGSKPIKELYDECKSQYGDLEEIKDDLSLALCYFKYHFPDYTIPEFPVMITAFGVAHPVFENAIGIGLDFYLGTGFKPYRASNIDFPEYKIKRLRKEYIVPGVLTALASDIAPEDPEERQFLEQILHQGKWLYFLDAMLPETPDTLKIGYTKEQLEWCESSESEIWGHLVENELIYSTDILSYQSYLRDGPFTSAPNVPQESAPRMGIWIGWQIIREYMDRSPEVTLKELIADRDYNKILKQSKYKPKQ